MGIRVSCLNFDPTVRKIYTDKEQPAVKVTLGNGSYLVEGYLDFYGPQCHVLIKWEPHTRDFIRELGDQASQRI